MTTNKPEAAHLADARAEFEKWASTHFFLQEEDTIVDDSYEYISVDMQLAWEAWYASSAAPDVAQLVEALEACDTALFCDLKTDEEKSTFFLSGRGYETGVIAQAIQNDVAMAYHRCSEYREEMEALQAENALLRAAIRRLCNIYVVDDYYEGQLREENLDAAVNRAINAAIASYRKGGE